MTNKRNSSIEQIIAKLDNDFNIDNSDYIPRIAAWVIEALSMLKCTKYETKIEKIEITEKIGRLPVNVDFEDVKIYCKKGCNIENFISNSIYNNCKVFNTIPIESNEQISIPIDLSQSPVVEVVIAKNAPIRKPLYFVQLDNNSFELNFDTDYVYIKYKTVKTYHSDIYNCDLPVIPNNGLLIEAITYYCLYKILCRGQKHPVFNLSASQYGTNPYYMWKILKDEAKRSVMFDEQGEVIDDKGEFRKSFFNFTFNPKE